MTISIQLYTPPNGITNGLERTSISMPPFYKEFSSIHVDNQQEVNPDVLLGSDLLLVYSGGSFNDNPSISLGGDPSSFPIEDGVLNNLFDDVQEVEAEIGNIDYRCIYFFNNSETATFWNPRFSIINNGLGAGAEAFIGFERYTERQRVSVYGTVNGGNFTLRYKNIIFTIPYSSSEIQWRSNFLDKITSVIGLEDVVVTSFKNTVSPSGLDAQSIINTTFEINFEGQSNFIRHPLLELAENNLSGNNQILINKIVAGGPIDAIAQTLDSEFSPPLNVEFNNDEYSFPSIGPGSGVPIWIKRVTSEDTGPYYKDNFNLKIIGNPFKI